MKRKISNMERRNEILARGRVVAIEPTFYDFAGEGVRAEEIVRHASAMRANTIRFGAFSHQGTAYYASEIAPRAKGLEERDFLAELAEACRRAKLHLVVYVNSGFDPIMGRRHPEWVRRDARGRKVYQGWLANLCNSSPYLDYFLSIAEEVARKYRPECLYVDNFMGGLLCRCEGCRRAYREATGREIPKAADFDSRAFRRYLAWHYSHQRTLWRKVTTRVRRVSPGTLVVFNRGTYLHERVRQFGCRQEEMIEDADALHYECAARGLNEDLASYINQTAKFGRAVGGRPWMWVEYAPFPWMLVSCPEAELELKAAKVIANNGVPVVWTLLPERHAEMSGRKAIRKVFAAVERNEDAFAGWEEERYAGLLYSRGSAEWLGRERVRENYESCYQGAFRALLDLGIPFQVVLDGDLREEGLRGFKVLVLPNAGVISERAAKALEGFVRRGGVLVATGRTSLHDEAGREMRDFRLAELFGVSFRGELANACAGYAAAVGRRALLPLVGEVLRVEASDAEAFYRLVKPPRYYCETPREVSDWPVVTARSLGKGKAIYVSAPVEVWEAPGAPFRTPDGIVGRLEWSHGTFSRMLSEVLGRYAGRPPVRVEAGGKRVEVNLYRQGRGRLIVTLVNGEFDDRRLIETVRPMRGVELEVAVGGRRVSRVRGLVSGREMPFEAVGGGRIRVRVSTFRIWEVVAIELGRKAPQR